MGVLSSLEPHEVFRYFEEICAIPHGSGNTKEISDYIVSFAKKRGLRFLQDDANNVVIWKDGTAGYEDSTPVMLQGHMDMVCEKEADCAVDFEKDGLKLRLTVQENPSVGDVLQSDGSGNPAGMQTDGTRTVIIDAEGTTLGGDDGIAVAYILAILASETIPHPPLEAVFTVDEEIGMLGAAVLDTAPLKSGTMLNIDSEDEGYLLVSCAGGTTAVCHLPVAAEQKPSDGITAALHVSGGAGGHSGIEIDKGRANANQLLGRALYRLQQISPFRILSVNGGKKDNAIPVESAAVLFFDADADEAELCAQMAELDAELHAEYAESDPKIGVSLIFRPDGDAIPETCGTIMTSDMTRRLITALCALPGGIQRMSQDIEGLVQTSLNMGILETTPDEVRMSFSVRSSLESEKRELTDRMTALMESLGGTVTQSGTYPAWEYRKESSLRDLMVEVFQEQYGRKPVVHAIHAGVECGLFTGKMPGLDCVSFGPDMKDIHTPRESMDVASVQRTWNYTLEVLRRLK